MQGEVVTPFLAFLDRFQEIHEIVFECDVALLEGLGVNAKIPPRTSLHIKT